MPPSEHRDVSWVGGSPETRVQAKDNYIQQNDFTASPQIFQSQSTSCRAQTFYLNILNLWLWSTADAMLMTQIPWSCFVMRPPKWTSVKVCADSPHLGGFQIRYNTEQDKNMRGKALQLHYVGLFRGKERKWEARETFPTVFQRKYLPVFVWLPHTSPIWHIHNINKNSSAGYCAIMLM